jgi:hypothetical protein
MTAPPLTSNIHRVERVATIEPRVVSVREARRLLGDIGKTKVFQLLALGKLRGGLLGRHRVITTESINQVIDELLGQ